MKLSKLLLYSVIQRLTLAKGHKIANTAMAAQHLNTSRSSSQSRVQANAVMLPSAYSEQLERFCEFNKGICPLIYRSKPGDTTAESVAGDSDIRYVKYFLKLAQFLLSQVFVLAV